MTDSSSVNISNALSQSVAFYLEPWGEEFLMPSGSTFNLVAESEQGGTFDIEYGDREIIVWLWPGSTVKVFCNGNEIGNNPGMARLKVPAVPENQTTSTFLREMLGKELKK